MLDDFQRESLDLGEKEPTMSKKLKDLGKTMEKQWMIRENRDSFRTTLSRRFETWQIWVSFQPGESSLSDDEETTAEDIFFANTNNFSNDNDFDYSDQRSCSFQISINKDWSSTAVARKSYVTKDSLVLQCLFQSNQFVIVRGAVLSDSPDMIHAKSAVEVYPHKFVVIPPGALTKELTGFFTKCVGVNDVMSRFMGEYSDYIDEKHKTQFVTACKQIL